jgi:RNA polymerase sigma factor (sigma-70 family)
MPTSSMNTVIQHLRETISVQDEDGLTDAQLLERFIGHRDEAAFATLVRRHGSMVMGVCLRVIHNRQDAEDAFQATFLVLVRKAGSIASRGLLANWLYGVAYNTALKARASNARRQAKEKQVIQMPDPAIAQSEPWSEETQALFDQELSRLPEKYRIPFILCELEGKTRKEAAQQLGCPEGSLSTRLSRGRLILAKRLARRGLAVPGGSLAVVLLQNGASACVPTSVANSTIKAATFFAAGNGAMISSNVIALTEGVLKGMLLSKLKIGTMWLLAGLIAFGAGVLGHQKATAQKSNVEIALSKAGEEKKNDGRSPEQEMRPDKPVKAAAEREVLQGTWRLVGCTHDGLDVPNDVAKLIQIEFQGNKMRFTPPLVVTEKLVEGQKEKHVEFGVGEGDFELLFQLHPTSTPKGIDLAETDGIEKGPVVKGIYLLEANRLKICVGQGDRPKDFSGKNQYLFVMERTKPAAPKGSGGKEARQEDEKLIQGPWKVVSTARFGLTWKNVNGEFVIQDKTPMAFPISLDFPGRVVFFGQQVIEEYVQGKKTSVVESDAFAVDTARNPKWITLTAKDGRITYGIYALDGDELRVCWQLGRRRDQRPTDFTTKILKKGDDGENDTEVWVLKREQSGSGQKPLVQKEGPKLVPVKQSWDGIIPNRKLLKASPPQGFIVEAEEWETMWQGWRADEMIPAIDFNNQMAIILTVRGPNKISAPELRIDDTGNVKVPLPVSTLLPDDGRIGYKIIIIERSGVKSINGTPIKVGF